MLVDIQAVDKDRVLVHKLWGTLSGVRPSKLVRNLFATCYSEQVVRQILQQSYGLADIAINKLLAVYHCQAKLEKYVRSAAFNIYIGIPFCPSICHYCSFASLDIELAKKRSLVTPLVDAICHEVELTAKLQKKWSLPLNTIYIGGGTPTALPIEQLRRIFLAIKYNFGGQKIREFTLEAGRPETINEDVISMCKEFSVTRISINPQTLNEEVRLASGRRHSNADFLRAFQLVKKCDGIICNVDLIAGLPGENLRSFIDGLNVIVRMDPQNITIHVLSRKRGSRWRDELDDSYRVADIDEYLMQAEMILQAANYHPYYLYRQKNMLGQRENVGYCHVNCESLYNVIMINEQQNIVGIGPGAASKIVSDGVKTIYNHKSLAHYLQSCGEKFFDELTG